MTRRVLAAVLCLVACGDDADSSGGAPNEGGAGGSSNLGGDTSSGGSVEAGGAGAGSAEQLPPTESSALFAWLGSGAYETWTAESAIHPSAGPHGGDVRTYVNDALFDSLSSGANHPAGAAAVKELYSGAELQGWAVGVKTAPDSAAGDNWYWYEIFSVTDPSNPVAAGLGVGLCSNCHAGGQDFVLTPFPLQ
jgi:hypothetical protein